MRKYKSVIITLIVIFLTGCLIFSIFFVKHLITSQKEYIEELKADNENLKVEITAYGTDVVTYQVISKMSAGTVFDSTKVSEKVMSARDIEGMEDAYVTDLKAVENYIVKTDLEVGTPLVHDCLIYENVQPTDRYEDVVVDVFPIEPEIGQYYDIHLVTPRGVDFLVLSKKRVINFYGTAVRFILNEEERINYNSALVDVFLNEGTYLYADVYVEPAMQEKAKDWYHATDEIRKIMQDNPNLSEQVKAEMLEQKRDVFESSLQIKDEELKRTVAGRKSQLSLIQSATVPEKAEETADINNEGLLSENANKINEEDTESSKNDNTSKTITDTYNSTVSNNNNIFEGDD